VFGGSENGCGWVKNFERITISNIYDLNSVYEFGPGRLGRGSPVELKLSVMPYSDINSLIANQKAHKDRINAEDNNKIQSTFNMVCSLVRFDRMVIEIAKQMPQFIIEIL
jgi:hypothetical protein